MTTSSSSADAYYRHLPRYSKLPVVKAWLELTALTGPLRVSSPKIPYPAAWSSIQGTKVFSKFLREVIGLTEGAFVSNAPPLFIAENLGNYLNAQFPAELTQDLREMYGGVVGNPWPSTLATFVAPVSYELLKGAVIEPTPALNSLLLNSDIAKELPHSLLHLPFKAQYVVLTPEIQTAFPNYTKPVGVYCFELPQSAADDTPGRYLQFTVIDELTTETNRKFITTHLMFKVLPEDEDTPVLNRLATAEAIELTPGSGLTTAHQMSPIIEYLMKLFLYLGLKDSIQQPETPHTDAMASALRKGPGKRDKALRQALNQYDRILVGPAKLQVVQSAEDRGGEKSAHWRRGHFRHQRFGVGLAQEKVVFIVPVLVRKDKLSGETDPAKKTYRVK